jgi:hypothetical protein
MFSLGLLILGLTWAGETYEWGSPQVLVTLVVGGVLGVLFVVWEYLMAPDNALNRRYRNQVPMIPWELLQKKDVLILLYASFSSGVAMYSVLYFCNIYFTMVKLWSADRSGVQLLYFAPGLGGEHPFSHRERWRGNTNRETQSACTAPPIFAIRGHDRHSRQYS